MKKKSYIESILQWLDDNIITLLASFLLLFIPLYPKIPLFEAIPGYIVRVRLEDILIACAFFVWLLWLYRGKITLKNNPLFKPIVIYLAVAILSMLSAVFIIKTVPFETLHVGKMVLHFLRRVEYFSLFFIFFSAIRRAKDLKLFILILLIAVVGVTLYGFGQKYLYWPAFSTMNREFSKGWMLYLTEHSRVLSTFGGHYDLAAFIMMALTIGWSLFFGIKNRLGKIILFLILSGSFWILILTASRTSFIAYLAAVSSVVFLWVFRRSLSWVFIRWFAVLFLSIFIMLSFGDLSERFTKLIKLDQRLGGLKQILLRPATEPPKDKAIFLVNNIGAVTSKSDQPPTTDKPGERPVDVTEDILEPIPVSPDSTEVVLRQRTYSNAALQYDLSTGIRLDALWPRAIAGFKKNPLLGSGYSTLTKSQVEEFTEAESTDNDFLRMLGETGILGTIAFLGILGIAVFTIWKALPGVKDPFFYGMFVGVIGLTFGLLINAIYIDVFEASKVAYSFWAILGLSLGVINVQKSEIEKNQQPLKIPFNLEKSKKSFIEGVTSDKFLIIIILIVAFYLRLYKIDSPVADWHSWRQADTAAVTRNFNRDGINLLYPTFDDLSSIPSGLQNPKGFRMVEFPLYNAASIAVNRLIPEGSLERSMRLTSIFASLGTVVYLFLITRKYLGRRTAFITSIIYSILPYNIFYGRVILPEPVLVFLSVGSLYYFDRFIEISKAKYYILSAVFGALAILVKPIAIFTFFPILYILYKKYSFKFLSIKKLYILALIIIIPFVLWRLWISQFPEGIPAYTWLLNGDGIRFKGAFFFWIFADRIGRLILGYWGVPLLLLGVLIKPKQQETSLFRWYGFSMLLYLFTFATGNVRHDYYQILIIPAIVIFLAKGVDYLLSIPKDFSRVTSLGIVIICLLFMEAFGWYQVRDFFNINHPEIVKVGEVVDKLTPKKSLVVAPYNGDTAFLYQTKRAGWPIVEGTIEDLVKKGAHFYVSVNFDNITNDLLKISRTKDQYLHQYYTIIERTDQYVIIQLVPNYQLPKD